MCKARNDTIEYADLFWAYDKYTGKRADRTGPCRCTSAVNWAIRAIDMLSCERIFETHLWRFEKIETLY